MTISEKANNLLNEFGKLQFDFAITLNKSLVSERDTARDNLANYIAELEAEKRWIPVGESDYSVGGNYVYIAYGVGYSHPVLAFDKTWSEWIELDNPDDIIYRFRLPQLPEVQE